MLNSEDAQPALILEDGPTNQVSTNIHVVMVSHEPGLWFEEVLKSVAAQDLIPAAVTVVNAGSEADLTERVQKVLPQAEVCNLESNVGFGPAVNEVILCSAEGSQSDVPADTSPDYFVICHDDVDLAPDALRLLAARAATSNASIVGPKYVDWDEPARICQLGFLVDKTGATVPAVEPGEYDQGQHDQVQDMFAVSGGCVLVRGDLFHAAQGFDPEMSFCYEHLDLCWRARVMGARVVVAPAAAVRHRQRLTERLMPQRAALLDRRHRIRTLLSMYGYWHFVRVIPQAALVSLVESVVALWSGRMSVVRAIVAAWAYNLRGLGSIRRKRKLVKHTRQASDAVIRASQFAGSAALATFLTRRRISSSNSLLGRINHSPVGALVGLAVFLFMILGARNLFADGIAAVGGLAQFGSSADLLSGWWSDHRPVGLGQQAIAPSGLGVLTVLSWLFFGQTGLLRTVLIVGMVPLGAIGMWHLSRSFGSQWVQGLAVAVYVANPIPYNALANGVWGGLLLYGAAPWLLAAVAMPPQEMSTGKLLRSSLIFGVVFGVVVALASEALVGIALLLVLVLFGMFLAAALDGAGRMMVVAGAGVVVAVLLNMPWLIAGMPARLTEGGGGGWGYSWAEILRFDTGPFGSQWLGWALPLAAVLPLVLAQEARLAWAVRGWTLYLGTAAAALASEHGWLSLPLPRPELIQVPGAVGLALATALGVAAFQIDLRRHHFGWRQFVPLSALVAMVLAILPALGMVVAGNWNATEEDYSEAYLLASPLADLRSHAADSSNIVDEGAEKVLWLGHRDLLPLGGWKLDDDLWFAVSDGQQFPTVAQLWVGPLDDTTQLIGHMVMEAPFNGSKRLGAALARWDIGTVLVVERLAPAPFGELYRPVPEWLINTLNGQLDLPSVSFTSGIRVYSNIAYAESAVGRTVTDDGF
ncbi:MAG: glycosyltransferase [Acidimicrobiia bacterium]|nr:glycosyltransferase [Acidimicrobiia bacterium]MYC58398.1 glycosyltransferase [Acidimicrobiia bacterium]MYI30496.1 glycosyltransferase [Acidimicrobiia bacterium]